MIKDSRKKILSHIQHALHRGPLDALKANTLYEELKSHRRGVLPSYANVSQEKRIELFIEKAQKEAAIVDMLDSVSLVPKTILAFLKKRGLAFSLRLANDTKIKSLPWNDAPELNLLTGRASENDVASLTPCLCGVAETGTLVLVSSEESPTTLNFLPEVHMVLLATNQIVAYYEDAWDLLRLRTHLPRTVNFITGPSRTADIEQRVAMGMHGPKSVYILMYNEDEKK